MADMIEALKIFLKYVDDDPFAPFNCEHDVLRVYGGPDLADVSDRDVKRLREIGFSWDDEYECWYSYRFGSC